MINTIEIQKIEEMRLQEGIDDVELRREISVLRAGDLVKLTLLTGSTSFETLTVRITSVHGSKFRGKPVRKPNSNSLSGYTVDSVLAFEAGHIHSIVKR